jgi:hypothetical protein
MLGSPDLDQLASAFAPDIETLDHRSLGTWSARGAEAALQHFRSLLEVAGEISMREYEILCLRSDALLVRRTHCGTDRVSGGAYERRFLMLLAFGSGGRIARIEWFEPDDDAEALARIDSCGRAANPRRVRRTPRPRISLAEAVIAARDSGRSRLFSGFTKPADHTTSTGGAEGVNVGWRSLMNAYATRSPGTSRCAPGARSLYHSRTSADPVDPGDLTSAPERSAGQRDGGAQGRRRQWKKLR